MAGWQPNINLEIKCNWPLKIITRLRTGRSAVRVREGARDLYILRNVHIGSAAHSVSYSMGTGASFHFQTSGCISHIRNALMPFASLVAPCKVPHLFPRRLPHVFFPAYPWPYSSTALPTLVYHICLGFLLLYILIWCQNHLSSILSTILITGYWFSVATIRPYLILSLLIFPLAFSSTSTYRLYIRPPHKQTS